MNVPALSRVLAVCAHPDDESFGLGALISTFIDRGAAVSVLCFTRGEASTLGDQASLTGSREEELRCAAEVLGIQDVVLLDYPDGALSEVALEDLSGHVRRGVHPGDALLVFDRGGVSGHPDHMRATEAALEAAADLGSPVYAWAVGAGVADVLNREFGTSFVGRSRSEIDTELHVDRTRQLRAITCHRSQSEENPVVWRRLELQADIEYLRHLKRTR